MENPEEGKGPFLWIYFRNLFESSQLFERQCKVTLHVSPYAVDMVGGITGSVWLSVHELDQEGRTLNTIVVPHPGFIAPAQAK